MDELAFRTTQRALATVEFAAKYALFLSLSFSLSTRSVSWSERLVLSGQVLLAALAYFLSLNQAVQRGRYNCNCILITRQQVLSRLHCRH